MPLNNPTAAVETNNGSYNGSDTVNRAVPHGLTKAPKLVVIKRRIGGMYFIVTGEAVIKYEEGTNSNRLAVTSPDTTNFYVGNATNYLESANSSTHNYYWTAIS